MAKDDVIARALSSEVRISLASGGLLPNRAAARAHISGKTSLLRAAEDPPVFKK
jgi:hypothetical protein